MDINKLKKAFENPGWEERAKPFWSWNGDLREDELIKQIDCFDKMGMGGYFCHSRIGLETEYLGEKWFDLVNTCADYGEKVKMQTWLYDEDRWPSGTAGGMVTKNPEYRIKYIRLERLPGGGEAVFDDSTVACFSADTDGIAFTSKKRIMPGERADGNTLLRFTIEEMCSEGFYNGYTYVDTMNPEATKKFIELTHEKYAEKCPGLGNKIAGIFTDEPHRGSVMCGFGIKNKDAFYLTPYTPALFSEFEKENGYDLRDFLPELFLKEASKAVHPVKLHYLRAIEQLFIHNFLEPVQSWCHEHNMLLTGHLLHEDTLTAQTCMMGSLQRAYEYFDIPGIDNLGETSDLYWTAKQVVSTARQTGKKSVLSEMYGCTGWHMRFKDYKAIGDWQALFGINLRCPHLSWYWMKGSSKRDYPAPVSAQSAWYGEYHYIEDYYARLNVFKERGEAVCSTLVLNPIESVWMYIHTGWSVSLGTNNDDVRRIEKRYFNLLYMLCGSRIDFDYGDEDIMARHAEVEKRDGKTVLRVGKAYYDKVLISGMDTIRPSTLKLLCRFADSGGRVIIAGEPPKYIDAVKSKEIKRLKAIKTAFKKSEIIAALGEKPIVSITLSNGRNADRIYARATRENDDYHIVIMNMNRTKGYKNCRISLSVGGYCEKWNARNGEVTLLTVGEPVEFNYDFAASEELCITVTKKNRGFKPAPGKGRLIRREALPKELSYRLNEPNVCTLNFTDYKINGGKTVYHKDVIQEDNAIRRSLGLIERSGEMLQPWFTAGTVYKGLCELTMDFPFIIKDMPEYLKLVVETPENFEILVNGKLALERTDENWVDSCFTVFSVDTSALKVGKNKITLKTGYRYDTNLEYIHLLGSFGVKINDDEIPELTKIPEKLTVGDITAQGMPFYGASVSYIVKTPKLSAGEKLYFSVPSAEAACIRVSGGGKSKIIAFYPFTADITDLANSDELEIRYVFNRKNTFEPCMNGIHFAGKYVLQSQGMCCPAFFEIRK